MRSPTSAPPREVNGPERRVAELEAELARARAEIDELRARVAGSAEGPDPVLTVDAGGVIVATSGAWPWHDAPPRGGERLWTLFDGPSGAILETLADRSWVGVGEGRFTLRNGRQVSVSVKFAGQGHHRVALHDVTALQVLDDAGERRRRMRALAELAGSLARELTDPMSIVQGRLELLLDLGVSDPTSVKRHLDVALEHSRRVTATLRNLRMVGWTPMLHAEPMKISTVVQDAMDLLGPRRERVLARVEPAELQAGGDGPLATRVLASLLRQSLESAGRAPVHLRARRRRGNVVLKVGPSGRSNHEAPADGEELALDRTLLSSIGGDLVASRSAHGLQFEVVLLSPPTRRARRRPLRGRIAVVGSGALHEAVTGLLAHDGYEFVCVRTGDEGITAATEGAPVDAVVAELLLDGPLSGLSLAGVCIERNPGLRDRVLLVSEGPIASPGAPVVPLTWPLARGDLLEALGHRVRR